MDPIVMTAEEDEEKEDEEMRQLFNMSNLREAMAFLGLQNNVPPDMEDLLQLLGRARRVLLPKLLVFPPNNLDLCVYARIPN
jgi:hypothetical protein